MQTEWFRKSSWNDKEKKEFFERLSRSRGDFNKAQYARIKALALFESNKHKEAIELLNFVLDNYPVKTELSACYNQLARAYAEIDNQEKAIEFYEKSIKQEKDFPNVITSTKLMYPEYIVRNRMEKSYARALEILKTNTNLIMPAQNFLYYGLMFLLLKEIDLTKAIRAKNMALEYADLTNSGMRYHKKLGLVNRKHWLLKELKK